MKHILINKTTGQSFIFSCKSDIRRYINVSSVTIWNWQRSGPIKYYKDYIICFNSTIVKASQKSHNQYNNRL
jgi:NDP-sugar pyrophosphorylase family protein